MKITHINIDDIAMRNNIHRPRYISKRAKEKFYRSNSRTKWWCALIALGGALPWFFVALNDPNTPNDMYLYVNFLGAMVFVFGFCYIFFFGLHEGCISSEMKEISKSDYEHINDITSESTVIESIVEKAMRDVGYVPQHAYNEVVEYYEAVK